jgi:ABC-type transporter Mla subunit MlaD
MWRAKHVAWMLAGLMAAACSANLDIAIRFNALHGLQSADRVLVDAQPVGEVRQVTYTDRGDFLVAVRIEAAYAAKAMRESLFFIGEDPSREGRKAVEIIPPLEGGSPLAGGDVVTGMSGWAARLRRMQDQMAAAIGKLAEHYGALRDEAQNLSQSEEIRRLDQTLDRILEDLQHLGRDARETLRTEVMPWIVGTLEALHRELEALGRSDQLDPLDEKVRHIEAELKV